MATEKKAFSHELRLRACGILIENDAILLAKVDSPASNEPIWMPPGGGVDFGESLHEGLKREFTEETNLEVEPGKLMHTHEFISMPYHALECYFKVKRTAGDIRMGSDPELDDDQQILEDLQWISLDELVHYHCSPKEFLQKITRTVGKISASSFSSQTSVKRS